MVVVSRSMVAQGRGGECVAVAAVEADDGVEVDDATGLVFGDLGEGQAGGAGELLAGEAGGGGQVLAYRW
jgi:hypothetical protein